MQGGHCLSIIMTWHLCGLLRLACICELLLKLYRFVKVIFYLFTRSLFLLLIIQVPICHQPNGLRYKALIPIIIFHLKYGRGKKVAFTPSKEMSIICMLFFLLKKIFKKKNITILLIM